MSQQRKDGHFYDEGEMLLIFEEYVRKNTRWLNFSWERVSPRYLVALPPGRLWRGQSFLGERCSGAISNATTSLRNALWFADESLEKNPVGAIYNLESGGRMLSLKRVRGLNSIYKDEELIVENPVWLLHRKITRKDFLLTPADIRKEWLTQACV